MFNTENMPVAGEKLNPIQKVDQCMRKGSYVKIYGEIQKGENDFESWKKQLDALSEEKDIVLHISTPGGDSSEVQKLKDYIDDLRKERGSHYYTLADYRCDSAGVFALTLGYPDGMYATSDTVFTFHGSFPESVDDLWQRANPEQKKKFMSERIRLQKSQWINTIIRKTGRSFQQIRKDVLRDKTFRAQQALQYGLIDGIYKGYQPK